MTVYDYYITPDEYERAAAIGVQPYTLERRIRSLNWSKEKALTTPPRKQVDRTEWRSVAEKNGVPTKVFYDRVLRMRWPEDEAATRPLCSPEQRTALALRASKAGQKYSDEVIRLRKQNGISNSTFHYRVHVCEWSPEKAATEPVMDRQRVGEIGVKARKEWEANQIFRKRG
jgi:hypothetical protein